MVVCLVNLKRFLLVTDESNTTAVVCVRNKDLDQDTENVS